MGLRPTTRLLPDGQTTDPSVSVPTAAAHRFAADATADPELDPHGSKLRRYGSRVKPPRALQPLNGAKPRKFAHSERFAFPRITAPASRSRATIGASAGTRLSTSASEPAVVCIWSSVEMLSLRRTGIPCSDPRSLPARRSLSSLAAIDTAFGFVWITAPSSGFSVAIRPRYPSVSSRLDNCPDVISA